ACGRARRRRLRRVRRARAPPAARLHEARRRGRGARDPGGGVARARGAPRRMRRGALRRDARARGALLGDRPLHAGPRLPALRPRRRALRAARAPAAVLPRPPDARRAAVPRPDRRREAAARRRALPPRRRRRPADRAPGVRGCGRAEGVLPVRAPRAARLRRRAPPRGRRRGRAGRRAAPRPPRAGGPGRAPPAPRARALARRAAGALPAGGGGRVNLGLAARAALVTGASHGIGLAVARGLADAGARVAICARDADRLHAAAASLRARGADVLAVPADVLVPADVDRVVDRVVAAWGTLHVLVNNVGGGGRW